MNRNSMKSVRDNRSYTSSFFAILISTALFILFFGYRVLNFTYVDWLLPGNDMTQHYIGWKFFRNSRWMFPYGLMDTLAYPNSCSIIYTDSIPVFAVLFKLLSPILPDTFQYFGLYGLLSFQLQGLFGYLIAHRILKKQIPSVLSSALFTISPILINRMFIHTALTSHWIILAALYMFFFFEGVSKKELICWFVLGYVAGGIHIYFVPMSGIISIGYVIKLIINGYNNNKQWLTYNMKAVLPPVLVLVASILHIWLLGGFSCNASYDVGGLGTNTFNLAALFYPTGASDILKDRPVYPIDYPCFNYLGLGVIIFIIISAVLLIIHIFIKQRRVLKEKNGTILSSAFIFCLVLVLSIIPNVCFGNRLLFTVPLPYLFDRLMNIFRSNSRFMWIDTYLLIIAALYEIRLCESSLENTCFNKHVYKGITVFLSLCITVQIVGQCIFLCGNEITGRCPDPPSPGAESPFMTAFCIKG